MGSFKLVQLGLALNVTKLNQAHDLVHKIEDKIKSKIPFIEKVIVHYE